MSVSVGIDLGTTFSSVAYVNPKTNKPEIIPNKDGEQITPSIIYFSGDKLIFDSEAEQAFKDGISTCAATFKRCMGDDEPYFHYDGKAYKSCELSAMLLKHLREVAEDELGEPLQDAVITVPAYFYSREREDTLKAAELAGLKVKKIIDEPNAAVLAYGIEHWRENANILVYDLGGGTFDVTLTHMDKSGELKSIVTRGDKFLGGRDWDSRLRGIIIDKLQEETDTTIEDEQDILAIRGVSETVKKKLSKLDSASVKLPISGYGYAEVVVTKKEFEDATADLVERTGELCKEVLDEAGIKWMNVTDILLVGGSTRMPQISAYLAKLYGKKPTTHVNPDEAVALGAAIQATKNSSSYVSLSVVETDGKKKTDRQSTGLGKYASVMPKRTIGDLGLISLRETTAHAMGMIAVSEDGTKYINDVIIPANHPRPVKAAKGFRFQVSRRKSSEMEIFVIQGEKENPLDNQIPFRYVVSGMDYNSQERGKSIIKVQYSYDDNGVIHVEARQDDNEKSLPIRREPVPADMSKYGKPIDIEQTTSPALNVVMAIDVSGSMSGAPMDDAKRAMCDFVCNLESENTYFGVVAVSDSSQIVCNLTNDCEECINKINSIYCGQSGYGNSAHPFKTINDMLSNVDGRLFAVILADGVWSNQQAAVEAAHRCNEVEIETAAIGFGSADERFLQDISSEDANAMFVAQNELSSAFGNIAQSLGNQSGTENSMIEAISVDTWGSE